MMNNKQRAKIIREQWEAKSKLNLPNISEEERASLRIKVDSLQRRLDAETSPDIFKNLNDRPKPKVEVDIFGHKTRDLTDEEKKEIFKGAPYFGVPAPEKEEPHLTYYYLFQNRKKK